MLRDFLNALAALERTPWGETLLNIISVILLFTATFAGLGLGGGM